MGRPEGEGHATEEQFAAASQELNAIPIPWIEPIDVSNALLFLASDEARYITGLTMTIDAGGQIV
jgi:NAD(P)-dependent dehydrogenase (short-subunit alcohol dehydrogenase family)